MYDKSYGKAANGPMSASRVISFRLPEEQVVALETVARFDGVALAEELREGVELLLAARRDDPEFLQRVRDSFEKARSILGEVDGGDEIIEALRPRTELLGDEDSVERSERALAHAGHEERASRGKAANTRLDNDISLTIQSFG